MNLPELSQLIVRRIMTRAQEDPDPVAYFSRALARLHFLDERAKASGSIELELIKFGFDFDILAESDTVN